VLVDLQVLPAAGKHRALLIVLHAPEERALGDGARVVELPRQRNAVARIVGMGRGAGGLQEGRHPVHGDGQLLGHRSGGRARRPAHHVGHADAALHQVHLAADQRPVVGEALAAIVAGEDDDGVARDAAVIERAEHPADALVHVVDHAPVGVDVAAVEVIDRPALAERLRQLCVVACLPGPVRRGVVQAEQEWLLGLSCARHEVGRARAQQIGEIAVLMDLPAVLEQVVRAEAVLVGEVVDTARQRPEMLVVSALQRAEGRREAEMPLADQGRAVPRFGETRRDCRMVGRQADHLVATHGAADRLLGRAANAVLVASRRKSETCRRADGGIGVAPRETHALGGHAVDVG
jgi:hypothetical protein